MKKVSSNKRGFTLIELLVVISIIGLLSSVVFSATNSAKNKAFVARSSSNVFQYRTALEIFYAKHEHYPGTSVTAYCLGDSSGGLCGGGSFNIQLNNQFLETLPSIPAYPAKVTAGGVTYNRYQYSCTALDSNSNCQHFIFYWYINNQDKCLNEKFNGSPSLISYNAADNVSVCAFSR